MGRPSQRAVIPKGHVRQNKALALKIRGYSIPDIRKALGYATDAGCRSAIRKASARQAQAPIDEARNIERLHLDMLRRAAVEVIADPDPETGDIKTRAIKTAIDIGERMSKLMGLDMTQTDSDENAVDMWLLEMGGSPEPALELTEEDDLDDDIEDLELDDEEEDFED